MNKQPFFHYFLFIIARIIFMSFSYSSAQKSLLQYVIIEGVWWISYLVFTIFLYNSQNYVFEFLFHSHSSAQKSSLAELVIFTLFLVLELYLDQFLSLPLSFQYTEESTPWVCYLHFSLAWLLTYPFPLIVFFLGLQAGFCKY